MTTMLGIWAHPDDEVFVSGGLLADAARRGDRAVCLHMTDGGAGLSFGQPSSPHALASVRRAELEASLACLGVQEQRFFGYEDGRLGQVPADEAIARIHEVLVELQPDRIVTFGRDGFTGHPDHQALSWWVEAATDLWSQPEARLTQVVMSNGYRDAFVPALNEFDVFWPGHPTPHSDPDLSFRLDDELIEAKVDALRCHASQMTPFFDAYGDRFMRSLASIEHYREFRVARRQRARALGSLVAR